MTFSSRGSGSPLSTGPSVPHPCRIRRRLGGGRLGTVYLADDLVRRRPVALKLLNAETFGPDGVARLQNEFRTIVGLHHPQIAAAYDFGYGEDGRFPFYSREYIQGVPLPGGHDGSASAEEFLRPILDLLGALEYLHSQDILHLDIHPGNLIVADDPDRGTVLIDFGVGGVGVPPFSSTREFGSTWRHSGAEARPPELLSGEKPGPAADFYSTGRLLLYRLTGTYEGEGRLPRELSGWGARTTMALERIIGKALHPYPDRRFTSASEFRDALAEAVGAPSLPELSSQPREFTLGRETELARIEEGLRRASHGEAMALWLTGKAGAGKSRLAAEARMSAQFRGLDVVSIAFLPEADSEPALQRSLRSRRGARDTSWLQPLDRANGGTSLERARRSAEAYFASTGTFGTESPLILLLDDVQHADHESRVFIDALLQECACRENRRARGRGMFVLVTHVVQAPAGLLPRESTRELTRLGGQVAIDMLRTFLNPVGATRKVLRRLVDAVEGNPSRLRHLAEILKSRYSTREQLPRDVEIPGSVFSTAGVSADRRWTDAELTVLRVLAVLGRAAERDELAAACQWPAAKLRPRLNRLRKLEVIAMAVQGRRRVFFLPDSELKDHLLNEVTQREAAAIHRSVARWLEQLTTRSPRQQEALARHLLVVGRARQRREAALQASCQLFESGSYERATRLLRDVANRETSRRWQLELAEEISELHGKTGDHLDGIAALEPVFRLYKDSLDASTAVRLRRRLGVHYHRVGRSDEAVKIFASARALIHPRRDRVELIFILSELAELHTLRV